MAPFRLSLSVGSTVAGFNFRVSVPVYPLTDGQNVPSTSASAGSADDLILALVKTLESDGTGARLTAGGETLDESFVCRWLRARDSDPKATEEAIRAHSIWRKDYVSGGRISEDQVSGEIAAQKVFLQGHDNEGCAVLVILACRHDMGIRDIKETERFICYVLDNASALADQRAHGDGKIRVLFDLSCLKLRNLDVKGLSAIFDLLQGHYPERLASLWFMNAPFIFWGVWRVVSPFINPTTRGKIRFVSSTGGCSGLREAIPLDILPKCYGGNKDLIPIEQMAANDVAHSASVVSDISGKKKVDVLSVVKFWKRDLFSKKNMGRWWSRRWGEWKNAANNPVTRAVGNHLRSGFLTIRTRVFRHKPQPVGQVPLRLIPKNSHPHSFLLQRRTPVAKIVVRVLVAELVILAIAGARTVVIKTWI